MFKPLRIAALCCCLGLAACGREQAMVANGYAKTAELSALDNQGRGSFATFVEPKDCLQAFKAQPDIATMQIRAVVAGESDRTYTNADLQKALNGQDFYKGVFVVGDAGLWFQKDFDCDSYIR